MKLCPYCMRAYAPRSQRPGAKQSACRACDADRRIIRHYRKLGTNAVCKMIDRAEQRLAVMKLYVRHPDLGASALLDLHKRKERENYEPPGA